MKTANSTKLSNAFSTGGGGEHFENRVQAVFLLALLIDGFAPVIDNPISRIEFQGGKNDYDVDDLIVYSESPTSVVRLHCQIKHSIQVSFHNDIFQSVITTAWNDYKENPDDKLALVTGLLAKSTTETLRYIHDQAIHSSDENEFMHRIELPNFTSDDAREKFHVVKICLQRANQNKEVAVPDLWGFWKAFQLVVFDLDYENSVNKTLIHSLIACKSSGNAKQVWHSLYAYASEFNTSAATLTRNNIPDELLELFGLQSKTMLPQTILSHEYIAQLALIGGWNEKNAFDKASIEKICDTDYRSFEKNVRLLLQDDSGILSLENGIWRVHNRRKLLNSVKDLFYDSFVLSAFEEERTICQEKNKRFCPDGEYSILVPSGGCYDHSETFRSALTAGLCLLTTTDKPVHCTDGIIKRESYNTVKTVFTDCDWIRLASLAELLPSIAELNPDAFLEYLEQYILDHSDEMYRLFPKKDGDPLFQHSFVTSVLWAIETLAWDKSYLVRCIRCLGALEQIEYDTTNYADTPLNAIVKILFAYKPQTLANEETKKSAVTCLKKDYPKTCWDALKHLMPQPSYAIIGNVKPRYILTDIPENDSVSADAEIMMQFYMHMALVMGFVSVGRVLDLADSLYYFPAEQGASFLENLDSVRSQFTEEELCRIWLKLCEVKHRLLLLHEGEVVETSIFQKFCETIESVKPQSKIEQYKRFYLLSFDEDAEDSIFDNWGKQEENKKKAVEELYAEFGVNSLIKFGQEVNALPEVGVKLGIRLNCEQMTHLLSSITDSQQSDFVQHVIRGYASENGYKSLLDIGLKKCNEQFIADALMIVYPDTDIIEVVSALLPEKEQLYWKKVNIPEYWLIGCKDDPQPILEKLLENGRIKHVINLIGSSRDISKYADEDSIYQLFQLISTDDSTEYVRAHSARQLIQYLQNADVPNIQMLSNIEYLCLPYLDDYSPVKPKALRYKIANDPDCFCSLVEIAYKKRHEDQSNVQSSEAIRERVYQIIWNFDIIPGMDWNGVFQEDAFVHWIDTVKEWAKENDRWEIVLQTIGNGLSYASADENGMLNSVILQELNQQDNDHMRRGYYLGVINSRGAHYIDPTGAPEKELGDRYMAEAQKTTANGYSRFADTLRKLGQSFYEEREFNIKRVEARRRKEG